MECILLIPHKCQWLGINMAARFNVVAFLVLLVAVAFATAQSSHCLIKRIKTTRNWRSFFQFLPKQKRKLSSTRSFSLFSWWSLRDLPCSCWNPRRIRWRYPQLWLSGNPGLSLSLLCRCLRPLVFLAGLWYVVEACYKCV